MSASSHSPHSLPTLLLPLLLYILSSTTTLPAIPSARHATPEFHLSPTQQHLLSTLVTTRLHLLSNISSTPSSTNRPYLSPASLRAQSQIAAWMREANLSTYIDPAGNVIGDLLCPSSQTRRSKVLLGSHHDTVPSAGRFDGVYGIISAISVAHILSSAICNLPFDIRVIAFDDEEGNNPFGSTNMGSRAYTGNLNWQHLDKHAFINTYQSLYGRNKNPIQSINSARGEVPLAYLELHLEQGPVLEQRHKSVAIVDAIAGQTRLSVVLNGQAGHAGTVPMAMRHDALTAAAEGTLAVERAPSDVVGTVGKLNLHPGVGNVVPGSVSLSVDIRSASDAKRQRFVTDVSRKFEQAGRKRGVDVVVKVLHDVPAVRMSQWLMDIMNGVKSIDGGVVTSGAGHDAQFMVSVTDTAMLFVRTRNGVSHRPDEFVADHDVFQGGKALLNTILAIAQRVKTG